MAVSCVHRRLILEGLELLLAPRGGERGRSVACEEACIATDAHDSVGLALHDGLQFVEYLDVLLLYLSESAIYQPLLAYWAW